ncbi:DUF4870 domain-containing protein [Paenibacillus sp. OV219]|uniref:DUF4870 domain-containing protein n=1 Tax=Paenibacillus sp. OV219 TaxID=1884377 RepID=UPI0008B832DE|nr:DUF4870 domain-containing protein [Paenibacillus sp. OV219]SEM90804.1 protein of unknown function [Paenibacillus sp. OV219]
MESNKIISALCYFSIFFAGFIVPVVIYFVTNDYEVKQHAKRALFSHLIPLIAVPLFLVAIFGGHVGSILFIGLIAALLGFTVVIWNVVMGIRVLSR